MTVLALVANRDMHLEKMDVKTTFLRGNLDEQISMEQSQGFRDTIQQEAVNWIFKYLKGTMRHVIMFRRGQGNPSVVGYVDLDYTGDMDDRRSTTGMYLLQQEDLFNGNHWFNPQWSCQQPEAEYMEATKAAKEVVWLT